MIYLSNLSADPYDSRDYRYLPGITRLPESVDLRSHAGSIEDQLYTNSCAANATVSGIELMLQRHEQPTDLSRLFLYYNARSVKTDTGSYLHDNIASVIKDGVPPEIIWPFEPYQVNTKPSQAAYDEAKNWKGKRYERIYKTSTSPWLNDVKSALAEGYPVIFGMLCGHDFPKLTAATAKDYQPINSTPTNTALGGHAMLIVGYTPTHFIVENSWGDDWADGGYCYLTSEVLMKDSWDFWIIKGFKDVYDPGAYLAEMHRTRLTAQIVPPASELGNMVTVWIGATMDGVWVLKNSSGDWVSMNESMPPAMRIVLQPRVPIEIVNNIDLKPFNGAEVYVAYGQTPFDWQVHRICEVRV